MMRLLLLSPHLLPAHSSLLNFSPSLKYSNTILSFYEVSSSYTHKIYSTLVYPFYHPAYTHSLLVTKLFQVAAFYHLHHSTIPSFFLTRHCELFTPQAPLKYSNFHCLDSRPFDFHSTPRSHLHVPKGEDMVLGAWGCTSPQ